MQYQTAVRLAFSLYETEEKATRFTCHCQLRSSASAISLFEQSKQNGCGKGSTSLVGGLLSCIRNLRELVEMPLSKPSYWIHSGYVPFYCASLRPSALRSLILQYISRPRALFLSSTWSLNLGFLPLHCAPALRNVQILHIR